MEKKSPFDYSGSSSFAREMQNAADRGRSSSLRANKFGRTQTFLNQEEERAKRLAMQKAEDKKAEQRKRESYE